VSEFVQNWSSCLTGVGFEPGGRILSIFGTKLKLQTGELVATTELEKAVYKYCNPAMGIQMYLAF